MIFKAYVNVARDSVKTNDYITFNNCGWSEKLTLTSRTYRPEGRNDYHIFYLSKGAYICNGENMFPGQICIYKPGEPQEYKCIEENSSYCWLHCNGDAPEQLFKDLDKRIYTVGDFKEFQDFCIRTTRYCNSATKINHIKIHGELLSLLCTIDDIINKKDFSTTERQMAMVAEHMATHFNQRLSNEEYAKMCNMSKFHFIRKFTSCYKTTPQKYLSAIILNQGAILLSSTNMRISQIADELGFASDMYFSTVFKKAYGMSPLEYRKARHSETKA